MKARLIYVATVEYEINPENYGDCKTPDEMIAIDLANANDDPYMSIGEDADWKISIELVKE